MRKFLKWTGIMLLFALIAAGIYVFVILPPKFDAEANLVTNEPLLDISDEAKALHRQLFIGDMHSDTLLWKRELDAAVDYGHMDLPRLQAGNVALQIFSSVTKTPKGQNYDSNSADSDNITLLTIAQLQPMRTWFSLYERMAWHGEKLEQVAARFDGQLRLIRAPQDIDALLADRAKDGRITGALFSGEGLHSLEGDIANLDRLYAKGLRMSGFTHFFDNRLAGSMHGEKKGALTDFGRQVMDRMEEKGMIIDIAHASHSAVAEILARARRPVVSSHGGVQATCSENRNLSDEEIRGVAFTGGLIGIGYWEGAVCSTAPGDIAKAMRHVRDLVGIEHVGLGSDFDGYVTTRFDTSQLLQVTQALMNEGFSAEEIRAVMGGNLLRILRSGLRPMTAAQLKLMKDEQMNLIVDPAIDPPVDLDRPIP
jgi:microsomal dipeptidase-like Zn-dependent dipeptidase